MQNLAQENKDFLLHNLPEYFQNYSYEIYRIVESQYFIATRKLVDSDEEQRVLEDIIDHSKPEIIKENSRGALHYLLYTPFRYPPLKSGGRFHTRIEQSIFYGAQELETSMAEVAYGRLLFAHHSDAKLDPMEVGYTHFVVDVKSDKALFLTTAPFNVDQNKISDPYSNAYSQSLGTAMRNADAHIFTYTSARRPNGINVGLFSVEAFSCNQPIAGKDGHWSVYVSATSIEFKRASFSKKGIETHVFEIKNSKIGHKR